MVGKWSCKNPLNIEERILIQKGIENNMTYKQISESCKRPVTTIKNECKRRCKELSEYNAYKAQEDFEMKQRRGKCL